MTVSHVLLLAFLCSNGNGQIENLQPQRDLSHAIQNLDKLDKAEIEKIKNELDKDVSTLAKEGEKLRKETQNLRVLCPQEIQALEQKFKLMMEKVTENQKILHELLKRMQEEEAEHIRLEAELKRVSEIVELLQFQHNIVEQNLHLAQSRQRNGTAKDCYTVTEELASFEQEKLQVRSSGIKVYKTKTRKMSASARYRMVLKSKIQMVNLFKQKLQKVRDEILREYQLELETCNIKKENLNAVIQTTAHALETSEKSIQILERDVKIAIDFSNAIRLEIKTGFEFLHELQTNVQKLREYFFQFRPDYVCYEGLEKAD